MSTAPLTVAFGDSAAGDVSVTGGKGAGLSGLTGAGVAVPPGFVATTAAFETALRDLDPGGEVRAAAARLSAEDDAALRRTSAELRERVTSRPPPEEVRAALLSGYRALSGAADAEPCPVAVRSSATGEDGADASFAGLQDTYLWVCGEDEVCAAVRDCWASLYSPESLAYRRRRGIAEDGLSMAVVVQRMVDPRSAGVMFTRSPHTGDRSVVAVEGTWGLGSALVGGVVTPDSFTVDKVTGAIRSRTVADKRRRHRRDPSGGGVREEDVPAELHGVACLDDAEVGELASLARAVERHYGAPQDIEWAVTEDGAIHILQSRPETVWAAKEAAPAATPRPRAFDHALDLLGGRR